ncbi:M48 family metalloprotease [Thiotrichales bacterium 19S11-10]|nr:M48 family metalloprotease [Thiotrichales bacterium 19S11-10]
MSQASATYQLITTPKERQLGDEILRQISYQTPILDDLLWQSYLNRLGNYLVGFSSDPTSSIRFFVAKSDQINAFALPGGIIVINSALILNTENEAQLAAVLSHEIAHVIQQHFMRIYQAYYQQLTINAAAIIASILVGGLISPELAQAGVFGSVAATQQNLISYTRAHEYEADRIGRQILIKAGYPQSAMRDFLGQLPRVSYHKALEPLLTHPVTEKRQAETISLNPVKGKDNIIETQKNYDLLKINLQVMVSDKRKEIKGIPSQIMKENYKFGLTELKQKSSLKAIKYLSLAWEESDENLFIGLAYIEALIDQERLDQAKVIIDILSDKNPSSMSLKYKSIEYLIASNQLEKARWQLYDMINNVPSYYKTYQQLALVYKLLGDVGLMHFYLAEYYYYQGQLGYAVAQLKLAKEKLNTDSRYYKEAQVKEEKWQAYLLEGS